MNWAHDTQLTPNFRAGEFASRGRLPTDPATIANILRLAQSLQALRDELGAPITVISGWRSDEHNEDVGGAPNSKHKTGEAGDLVVKGIPPKIVYQTIRRLQRAGKMAKGGAKAYGGKFPFTHYDIRGFNVTW